MPKPRPKGGGLGKRHCMALASPGQCKTAEDLGSLVAPDACRVPGSDAPAVPMPLINYLYLHCKGG